LRYDVEDPLPGGKPDGACGDRHHSDVSVGEAMSTVGATPPAKAAAAAKPRDPSRHGLVTESDPRSPAAEAYRTLRTNIRFAGLDNPCRSIAITSAGPGEGKTTTAANFAVVAAQAESRVCLVDADMRRPALHRVFGVKNVNG